MIYFVEAADGCIKIGHAVHWRRRFSNLRQQYGRELKLLALMDGDTKEEMRLHNLFADARCWSRDRKGVRRWTEWFVPTAELKALIQENETPFEAGERLAKEMA